MLEREDKKARRLLFSGSKTELCRKTGIPRRTLYDRIKKPGKITLDELAGIVWAQDIDKDELWDLISRRA